jgi:hypothetical protein
MSPYGITNTDTTIKIFEEIEKNENKRRIMIVDTPYLLG